MYLWVGEEVSSDWLQAIFEPDAKSDGKSDGKSGGDVKTSARLLQTSDPAHIGNRVSTLVATLRKGKPAFQNLQIINQTRKMGTPRSCASFGLA